MPKPQRKPRVFAKRIADKYINLDGTLTEFNEPREPANFDDGQPRKSGRHVEEKPKRGKPGQPTLYEPRYCNTVVEDAMGGHSLAATGHLIGVSEQTLYNWQQAHPEFLEACARARQARQRALEAKLFKLIEEGGDNTQFQALRFSLTNVSPKDWRDRIEPPTTNVNVSLSQLITDSIKRVDAQVRARAIEDTRD